MTLGPIWTFSLRGVLTFMASGLDINGCVLSYFEGTANLHFMKKYNKILKKNVRGVLTSVRYCN